MPILDKIKEKLHLQKDSTKDSTKDTTKEPVQESATTAATAAPAGPVFDQSKVDVIFVLGGPGAGKGTQCAKIVQDFDFAHLSAGDLLRAEQAREGSPYGELIRTHIREGRIVPMEVTVKLLENAMAAIIAENRTANGWGDGRGRFLVDGFPREMDQGLKFENEVCVSRFVLFFTCTEAVMLDRLLERGKTSGREDDNAESIKKRFRTYQEVTMPVIEHYRKQDKVREVDATSSVEEVHAKVKETLEPLFGLKKD